MKEGMKYKLNSVLLSVTYTEGSIVYLTSDNSTSYKYDKRKDKVYFYNTAVSSWDSVEGELKECSTDVDWNERENVAYKWLEDFMGD